jgi:hypothetical protein
MGIGRKTQVALKRSIDGIARTAGLTLFSEVRASATQSRRLTAKAEMTDFMLLILSNDELGTRRRRAEHDS